MSVGIFRHRKSGREIEVPYIYVWHSDTFYARYLGREFAVKLDKPYIGRNWIFLRTKGFYDEIAPKGSGISS